MINYCVDYIYQYDTYVESDTFIFDSNEDREYWINNLSKEYKITEIYENENCYCHAYYEGECACGNFK